MTDSSRLLLDSHICIRFLAAGSPALRLRMNAHRDALLTSSICFGDVMIGLFRAGGDTATALEFFEKVPVAPYDRDAAIVYAGLPFRRGKFDRLIGAHALALGAVLVTDNGADFADMPGLRLENWLE